MKNKTGGTKMPELCRFYNIIIKMIYSDNGQHNKPHFHVYFAEYEASVGVDGELLAGSLPVKQPLSYSKKGECIHTGTSSFFSYKLYTLYVNYSRTITLYFGTKIFMIIQPIK